MSLHHRTIIIMQSTPQLHDTTNWKRCRNVTVDDDDAPTQRPDKRRKRKSVGFSPSVRMRCYFVAPPNDGQHGNTTAWLSNGEVDKMKRQAKALGRVHRHIRRKTKAKESSSTVPSSADDGPVSSDSVRYAPRYEIKGESLRGMENVTDAVTGEKRQRVQDEAIRAVMVDQQGQLSRHIVGGHFGGPSCDSPSPSLSDLMRVKGQAARLDAGLIARAYGTKARESLEYARCVAEEDEAIAAAILAEDLKKAPALR